MPKRSSIPAQTGLDVQLTSLIPEHYPYVKPPLYNYIAYLFIHLSTSRASK